jgi:hypothetical protein
MADLLTTVLLWLAVGVIYRGVRHPTNAQRLDYHFGDRETWHRLLTVPPEFRRW